MFKNLARASVPLAATFAAAEDHRSARNLR